MILTSLDWHPNVFPFIDLVSYAIAGCFISNLFMSLGLCHSGADQRDYLYFIAEGYYKLKVSLN